MFTGSSGALKNSSKLVTGILCFFFSSSSRPPSTTIGLDLFQGILYQFHPVEEFFCDHQDLRIRLVDDVAEKLTLIRRVDGNLDRPDLRGAEPEVHVFRAVGEHDG